MKIDELVEAYLHGKERYIISKKSEGYGKEKWEVIDRESDKKWISDTFKEAQIKADKLNKENK